MRVPPRPPDPNLADENLVEAMRALGSSPGAPLCVDGAQVEDLAARHGTPLYVFSADALRARVATVRDALGDRVELLWSIKANPSVAVTGILREAGVGAEVASTGELLVALAAGHDAAALRFAGPGKTDLELDDALARGLGTFHVESVDELQALADLASTRDQVARVALRVNLPDQLAGSRLRMGGRSSRFGVDLAEVPAAVGAIQATKSLSLCGLHVYGGTQVFDADAFVAHARALCEHAARWEQQLDVRLDEIDLGGGFGVAVFQGDPSFDLQAAGRGLRALLAAHDRPDRRWFVELGRYLAAPAGAFVTKVTRKKTSGDQLQLTLDGGMHHAAAAAGIGAVLRRTPLLTPVAPRDGARQPVTLGGPLCTPADEFADQLDLPPLARGDLVAILNAGAYGLTYSPTRFLSHASPAEVLVDGGVDRVVRRRGEASDALRDQVFDQQRAP